MAGRNGGCVRVAVTNVNTFPEVWNLDVKAKDRAIGRVRLTGRYWEKNRYEEVIRKVVEEFQEEQLLVESEQVECWSAKEEAEEGYSRVVAWSKEEEEVEVGLAEILFDVPVLRDEFDKVAAVRNADESKGEKLVEALEVLESVAEELEEGKRELAAVKEEGVQFMSSMNVARRKLVSVVEERARMRKTEGEADTIARYLNSELVKAKQKLESATAAEEKAMRAASDLTVGFELQKSEAEAAKRETQLLNEGIAAIRTVIDTMDGEIDSAEERLQAAMVELESVQASEATVLGHLEVLIDRVSRQRASMYQNRGCITISKYEFDYLRERAARVEEVAEKKVTAAMAWAKSLEASKNEIVIRSEMARREVWELRFEEEQHVYSTEMVLSAKKRAENKLMNQRSLLRQVEGEPMNRRSLSRRAEGETMNQRSLSSRVQSDLMNRRSVSVKRRVKYELKNRKPKIEEDSKADNVQPTLPEAPAGSFCKSSALPMNRCPSLRQSKTFKLENKKKKAIPNLFKLLDGGRTKRKVF